MNLMTSFLRGSIAALAGIFLLPAVSCAQHKGFFKAGGKNINVDSFNREINSMMDQLGVPGLSLAVIDDNKVVFYHAYGIKKKGENRKVDQRTVFVGCSNSKSYLVYMAYRLVDQGKLDLDRPLYQYLEYDRLAYDPRYKLITARMVLSHSSGLENWQGMNDPNVLEILYDPGKEYNYSGEGYQYLAKVVEKIVQQPYEQYITEQVIKPLHLKNSYLRFKKKSFLSLHRTVPWDYTYGLQVNGRTTLFNRPYTIPASGNYFTAEDYAKLIIATFDPAHISAESRKNLIQPVIPINNSGIFYGPGFEVMHDEKDTIISQGGDNSGYKNLVYYSIPKKRGIVIMTSSDLGKLLTARICEMAGGLYLGPYLGSEVYLGDQYPSNAVKLFKLYEDSGFVAMKREIGRLQQEGRLEVSTMNVVSYYFRFYSSLREGRELLQYTMHAWPEAPYAYAAMGEIQLQNAQYDSAYTNLKKAKELHFGYWKIDGDLEDCEKAFADAKRRQQLSVTLNTNGETLLRAENFNAMNGINLWRSTDEGGGQMIGKIDSTDWMDYKVNITGGGTYKVGLRIASQNGNGLLELSSGNSTLARVPIPSTNDWKNWTMVTTTVHLPEGSQTLRVASAGKAFNLNWIRFSPEK
jgi:CubicO group peptidase (beta-lactamase class C family)